MKIKIDFTNYNSDWVNLVKKIARGLGLTCEGETIVEIAGEVEKIEIFRQMVEMTDGGSIV